MKPILRHARANLIAYLALFVALGGTSYAAINLPANSVGTRQLKNNSITPIKFNRGSVGAYVRAWAVIGPGGHLVASRPKAKLVGWDPAFAGGIVRWSSMSAGCFAEATGDSGFVWATVVPGRRNHASIHFDAFTPDGQPDDHERVSIAVLCQP